MIDLQPDEVELALARRELELERRLAELVSGNQIEFFKPHPKQKFFFDNANYRYRYGRTGNRFGKSEMGAAEDVSFALGYRPWIPVGDPTRTRGIPSHPTKGLIVTTDWDKSTEVFTSEEEGTNQGKLFKYIPKDKLLGFSRNHSGAIDTIRVRHVTGGVSVIHIDTVKSFKGNQLGSESSVWDWAHIDEPIPEKMWKAIARGFVDRGGRGWFTCTPLTEPWIDEAFMPDLEANRKDQISFSSGDRFMMTGTIYDNPHNTPEDIASFLAWLTPDEQECRINGLPTSFSGLVYKEFDWNIHVRREPPVGWVAGNGVPSWNHPPKDYTIRLAIDYHPRKPHHVLFIATSPSERHYVYAELFISCVMSDLVSEIKAVLHGGEPTLPGLIDPLADTPNRVTDITPLEEVQRLGLPVVPATKDPYNGILKVKEILNQRDRAKNAMITFNTSLPRMLMEISRGFVWDQDTNKPVKDKDDACENLYRLCLQGLTYVEPSTMADYRIIPPCDLGDTQIDAFELYSDNQDFEVSAAPQRSTAFSSRYRK